KLSWVAAAVCLLGCGHSGGTAAMDAAGADDAPAGDAVDAPAGAERDDGGGGAGDGGPDGAPEPGGTIPAPRASHPGNIFLTTEDVVVPVAAGDGGGWQAVDYDGKVVGSGMVGASGTASLGKLGVGYYEVRRTGGASPGPRVTAAVLEPLHAPTPLT